MLDLAILGLLHESPMHGLRAAKAADHEARCVPGGHLVRVPVPDATPASNRRLDLEEPGAESTDPEVRADEPAGPGGLQDHGGGQGALPGAARRGRTGNVRGHRLRCALAFFSRTDQDTRLRILEGRRRKIEERREACARRCPAPPSDSMPTRWNCNDTDSKHATAKSLVGGAHRHRALRPPAGGNPADTQHRSIRSGHAGAAVMIEGGTCDGSVRVAIVGVGNCASSLVQGVEYYRNADPNSRVPGLMHVTFGDYQRVRRGVRRGVSTWTPRRWGVTWPRRCRQREQHHQALRRPRRPA